MPRLSAPLIEEPPSRRICPGIYGLQILFIQQMANGLLLSTSCHWKAGWGAKDQRQVQERAFCGQIQLACIRFIYFPLVRAFNEHHWAIGAASIIYFFHARYPLHIRVTL